MEADPDPAYAAASTEILHGLTVQLGTQRRHDAIVSTLAEAWRSTLPRSCCRCGSDPRATWLSATLARHRISRSVGPRNLCLSGKGTVGGDCAFARYRLA